MADLPEHCEPCTQGTPPLTEGVIASHLADLADWVRDGTTIKRRFVMKDFRDALRWVNRVGMLAEEEDHHPDIFITGYKHVQLTLTTHAIGGLSLNDFVLARKIDALAAKER